jgi:hypothetical protein
MSVLSKFHQLKSCIFFDERTRVCLEKVAAPLRKAVVCAEFRVLATSGIP